MLKANWRLEKYWIEAALSVMVTKEVISGISGQNVYSRIYFLLELD